MQASGRIDGASEAPLGANAFRTALRGVGAGLPGYVAELHARAVAGDADFTVEEMGRIAHVFHVDDALRGRHPEIGSEVVAIGLGADHRGRIACKEHDAASYERHLAPAAPVSGRHP